MYVCTGKSSMVGHGLSFQNTPPDQSSCDSLFSSGVEVYTSLPLQMTVYFNAVYAPLWAVGSILALQTKVRTDKGIYCTYMYICVCICTGCVGRVSMPQTPPAAFYIMAGHCVFHSSIVCLFGWFFLWVSSLFLLFCQRAIHIYTCTLFPCIHIHMYMYIHVWG